MKIISVVGARPNFMKIAPFHKAIEDHNKRKGRPFIEHILLHTGQHYDDRMSGNFFMELNLPEADINLGVGSGSHAEQVGQTMIRFETVLKTEKPDWVVVVGDVNATLACSVTAKKENIRCCHIEAGLRSGDMSMPEEINRLVTDRLCDLLLVPDRISVSNLEAEGVPEKRIRFVGNIMIDTLELLREKASLLSIDQIIENNLLRTNKSSLHAANISPEKFALLTIHRPSNVDDRAVLTSIAGFLTGEAARRLSLVWPLHPRTEKQLREFDLFDSILNNHDIILLKPLGYLEMMRLNMSARMILTDSGGLQEESTVLGTPCLTFRWNTERPVTLRKNGGTSILVGNDAERIRKEFLTTLEKPRCPVRPELWDGNTARRCLQSILEYQY